LFTRIGREGKRSVAVTHLALLGVKKQEAAFWVFDRRKEQSIRAALLRCFGIAGACNAQQSVVSTSLYKEKTVEERQK